MFISSLKIATICFVIKFEWQFLLFNLYLRKIYEVKQFFFELQTFITSFCTFFWAILLNERRWWQYFIFSSSSPPTQYAVSLVWRYFFQGCVRIFSRLLNLNFIIQYYFVPLRQGSRRWVATHFYLILKSIFSFLEPLQSALRHVNRDRNCKILSSQTFSKFLIL